MSMNDKLRSQLRNIYEQNIRYITERIADGEYELDALDEKKRNISWELTQDRLALSEYRRLLKETEDVTGGGDAR
jgi:predicted  nucleic acid-binding Zn-ribbon protein